MTAYYNENDPKAAAWLRELMWENQIAPGDVDTRSIEDVRAGDLAGYDQCHFFAGIGGWSYALRLAGWPDNRPVWTGSCPCQPFSHAGSARGCSDRRHLFPVWADLIRQRHPPTVFGEQVASPAGLEWFDAVAAQLEAQDYAVGAADLPAGGVGAPHRRQRLYFVGHAHGTRLEGRAHATSRRPNQRSAWTPSDPMWCRDGKWRPVEPGTFPLADGVPGRVGLLRGYGNAVVPQVACAFIQAANLT